ncbi:MAG: hypothetical protein QOK10_1280 [Pseudonocardiales bacterium]|jgi:hypothetical protein|nr:hypothetical protein [Pseudonocardiales bacterium]
MTYSVPTSSGHMGVSPGHICSAHVEGNSNARPYRCGCMKNIFAGIAVAASLILLAACHSTSSQQAIINDYRAALQRCMQANKVSANECVNTAIEDCVADSRWKGDADTAGAICSTLLPSDRRTSGSKTGALAGAPSTWCPCVTEPRS